MTVSIYKRYLNDLIKLFIMTKENNEVKKKKEKRSQVFLFFILGKFVSNFFLICSFARFLFNIETIKREKSVFFLFPA